MTKDHEAITDEQNDASFLNRWSARKHNVSQQTIDSPDAVPGTLATDVDAGLAQIPAVSDEQTANTDLVQDDVSEQSHFPVLTDEDMPAIKSLSSDSDLSAFFSEGVSAALRKAALRHVFQQPKYNVRDGLNDYDGDYTVFEPLGDTITSDMKWHTARKERERLEAEEREREALAQQELEESAEEQSEEQHEEQPQEHEALAEEQPVDEQSESDESGTESLAAVNPENCEHEHEHEHEDAHTTDPDDKQDIGT